MSQIITNMTWKQDGYTGYLYSISCGSDADEIHGWVLRKGKKLKFLINDGYKFIDTEPIFKAQIKSKKKIVIKPTSHFRDRFGNNGAEYKGKYHWVGEAEFS